MHGPVDQIREFFEILSLALGIVEILNLNTRIWSKEGYQRPPRQERKEMPYEIMEAFEFIGLGTDCTEEEFKERFRERQKALHPDGKDAAQQRVYNDLTAQFNRKVEIIRRYKGW